MKIPDDCVIFEKRKVKYLVLDENDEIMGLPEVVAMFRLQVDQKFIPKDPRDIWKAIDYLETYKCVKLVRVEKGRD